MSSSVIAFLLFTAAFIGISLHAARSNRSPDDHYVAARRVPAWQNGLAITGEFASAASFLGISGAIALSGYGGFYLALGVPLSFLLLLLLVAEPMRRSGKYTVADVLASRFPGRGLRVICAVSAVVITALYMIAQFVGAGTLLAGLIDIDYELAVLIVGALMATIVLAGGMIAATRIQVFKTFFLLFATALLLVLVLQKISWNPFDVIGAAADEYGAGAAKPNRPPDGTAKIDAVSLSLALALGTASLPHIMIRFLTVPTASAARRSALIACSTMSVYLVGIAIIGYGAATLVGRDVIADANSAGTTAVPMLAAAVGNDLVEGLIAGITFAVIVAVLAGLVIAASGALAHDLFTTVVKRGQVDQGQQLKVARWGGAGVCIVAIVMALGAREINLAFLGVLAFSVGASTNLPPMIFGLYWKRFNATGAMVGMCVGLGLSIVCLLLGPNVLGDDAPFPLAQPGIVTIPLGFLAAIVGTFVGERRAVPGTPPAGGVRLSEAD